MHRHNWKIIAFLCTAIAAMLPFSAQAQQPAAKPNVIMIYADDMAYGDMSANGLDSWVKTPNLDKLSASGIRFTDGYSAAPVCGPSRVALLTGQYPATLGTWWNPDTRKTQIPDSRKLLPAMMRDAGYISAVIGKWNLPTDPADAADITKDIMTWGAGYWPNEDGSYTGVGSGSGAGGRASGLWGPQNAGDEYLTNRLTRHTVEFVNEQNGEKPFFVYLAYNAPHSPLEAEQRFRDAVAHLDSEPKRLYAAMVMAIDEGVGQVMEALEKKGLAENTLVVFVSDNGPAKSGFRGYQPEWPKEVLGVLGPLSGTKGTFREGGVREPFVMSWPAGITQGQVSSEPVVTVDIYKTLASIVGAPEAEDTKLDGADLSQLFGPSDENLAPRDILWAGRICRANKCKDSGAMRNGDWKLLIEDNGKPALFNLSSDLSEANDLSNDEPGLYAEMTARYSAWKDTLPPNASGTQGKARPNKNRNKNKRKRAGKNKRNQE